MVGLGAIGLFGEAFLAGDCLSSAFRSILFVVVLFESAGSLEDDEAVLELAGALVLLAIGGTKMAVPDDVIINPPWFMFGIEFNVLVLLLVDCWVSCGLGSSPLFDSFSDVSLDWADDDELFRLDDDESFFSNSEFRCSSNIIFSLSSSSSPF